MRLSQVLLGVPKYRTSLPRKQVRKFGWIKLYRINEYIVTCHSCNSPHDVRTLCGVCYDRIRETTNSMKKEMMKYNLSKGQTQQPYVSDNPLPNIQEVITEKIEKNPGWFGWKNK